ncbi:GTPase Der [Candidatus Tremblaya princeps]|uniref:GTPase Der n=1 Tax=Tremblaya princeps TaxID=189385 RepID=A0A143WNQ9_TREPR|nr:GTPase Der [Candidatus Tremblaya princeps]
MIPVISILGAPNVGKSTLFNLVTHGDSTPVSNIPGTTGCSRYGAGRLYRRCFGPYNVVDTEGYGERCLGAVPNDDSHAAIILLDASVGATPVDAAMARSLCQGGCMVYAAVNKSDPGRRVRSPGALHAHGVFYTSAAHNTGVLELMREVLLSLARCVTPCCSSRHARRLLCDVRIAVAGRRGVGKTTLLAALTGTRRAQSVAGLRCRALHVMVGKHACALLETPGVGAWSPSAGSHRLPLLATLRVIALCDAVLLVVGCNSMLHPQDALVLGYSRRRRKPVVLCAPAFAARPCCNGAQRAKAGALVRALHAAARGASRLSRHILERMRAAINTSLRSEGICGRAGCVRQGGSLPLRLILTCRNAPAVRRRAGCVRAAARAALGGGPPVAILDIREDRCAKARA